MGVLGFLADLVSAVFLIAGAGFFLVGAIGLNRMPDLFTRMHAVSVADTLGLGLLLVGMLIQAGPTLVAVKLIFIFALIFLSGPISTHALARAALHDGARPQLMGEDGEIRETDLKRLFPELDARVEAPLISETVESPEAPLPKAEEGTPSNS